MSRPLKAGSFHKMTMGRRIILTMALLFISIASFAQVRYVAISTSASDNGFGQVSSRYFNAILAVGAIPVAVPQTSDEALLKEIISGCYGVILTGGEDINPAYFGEEPIPELGKVNDRRDTCDHAFFKAAMELDKPILGICRGEQVINVFLGGSLYQDLPSQTGTKLTHKFDSSQKPHTIVVDPTTNFGQVLVANVPAPAREGAEDTAICEGPQDPCRIAVNSAHHQGVKRLADGLRLVAVADDGVVEAYESAPGAPHSIIAVQFHPEAFAPAGEEPFISIFRYFMSLK